MKQFIEQLTYDLYRRADTCEPENDFDGRMGARISAIFVTLVTSAIGSYLPVLSSRYSVIRLPSWVFFGAKYFGSGVIVATAFIHLLQPANENLSEECLGGTFQDYPWAFGISLMSLFAIFFAELLAFNFVERKLAASEDSGHTHSHFGDESLYVRDNAGKKLLEESESDSKNEEEVKTKAQENPYPSHFSHAQHHQDPENIDTPVDQDDKERYFGQLVSVLALEFGILFHSVFIGLTLAVSGDEFPTLYPVVVFHQTFEGLGLGTRIASTAWPRNKRWLPYVLCLGYTLVTPIAIAIGLGVRETYSPGSRKALITNGVFDALSSGILIYTGLVELMAHEFLFSDQFKGPTGFRNMLIAFFIMCWGAGLMALLGKWA